MCHTFITRLEATQNEFLLKLKTLPSTRRLYIYGYGMAAKQVTFLLRKWNIVFSGYLVNKAYYKPDKDCFCLEDVCSSAEEHSINLIVGFRDYRTEILEPYSSKIATVIDMDCWGGLSYREIKTPFTFEWCKENADDLENFYQMLEDELSRDTLIAFCNQKISMNYKYLANLRQKNQYFEDGLVTLSDHEVFIDCGAYNGDSALDFIEALKRRKISHYDKIISFEPNPDNFVKLTSLKLPRHECHLKGVSQCKATVYFDDNDTSSCISNSLFGKSSIEVDTIDNILHDTPATFIKMDIEGEELCALQGAEKTIVQYKPLLAICVYHKAEDLITIPQYIHSIVPKYRFYLRAYEKNATEIILYALMPKEEK